MAQQAASSSARAGKRFLTDRSQQVVRKSKLDHIGRRKGQDCSGDECRRLPAPGRREPREHSGRIDIFRHVPSHRATSHCRLLEGAKRSLEWNEGIA
eukprot:4386358-Prymnesium_polylepis.1